MSDPETPPLFDDVAPAHRTRGELVDLYTSSGDDTEPRPAIVFVHGGPVVPDEDPRDWPGYAGYATLAVASGLVGVVLRHHLYDDAHFPDAAGNVVAALEHTRGLDGVDPDRIGLWFFSVGGPLAVDWMHAAPSWLRFLAWTYPVLAPPPEGDADRTRFDVVQALGASRDLPKLLVRVEQEFPMFVPDQVAFVDHARALGAALDVITVPEATHGFEGLDDYPPGAKGAVQEAIDWAAARLRKVAAHQSARHHDPRMRHGAVRMVRSVLIEHRGRTPTVPESAYVAPSAVFCGAVVLGERVRVLHGAVLTAEDGPVEVGQDVVIMENALVRGRAAHQRGRARQHPGAAGVDGADRVDRGRVPGAVLPAGRHEDLWAVQKPLDCPGTVYGASRDEPWGTVMARQVEYYGEHRHDRVVDPGRG